MPISVSYWRLPEEEEDFITFLEKDSRVVAFPAQSRIPFDELPPEPPSRLVERGEQLIILALKPNLDEIRSVEYTKDGSTFFGIDSTNSPVIMYERSDYREPGKLGQSAIAYHDRALSKDKKELHPKPEEFIRWARNVVAWVRKNTPLWHEYKTYRITQRVHNAVKEGLELVP